MAKFFQHVNSDDPLFQTTTKLLYVDDNDPDMLLYIFEDGSKCNADLIGKINDPMINIGMYQMVEVESPVNIWRFKPIEVKQETIKAKNASNEEVEVPDPYFVGLSGSNTSLTGDGQIKEGTRWESRPPRQSVRPIDDINEYYGSYIKYAYENNVKINKDINISKVIGVMEGNTPVQSETPAANTNIVPAIPIKSEKPVEQVKKLEEKKEKSPTTVFKETKKQLIINADELLSSNDYDIVKLTFNGEEHEIDIKKFFEQSIEEQKIVEVEQPHIDEPMSLTENDIEIDIINTPEWNLVNNMINMSQKEECSIDMELLLSLPPIDVYKLIKSAYPAGLSDAFVKTIANRMPIKELRIALAHGLMSYYDTGTYIEEVVEPSHIEDTVKAEAEKKTAKKPRAKKS